MRVCSSTMTVMSASSGRTAWCPPARRAPKCVGGDPVAVDSSIDERRIACSLALGDHRRDFTIEGTEDLVGEFGVECESALEHSGVEIELAGQERVAALPSVAFETVVAFEPSGAVADVAGELFGRHRRRGAEQLRGLVEQ